MRFLIFFILVFLMTYSAVGQTKHKVRSKFEPVLQADCQNLPTLQYDILNKIYYSDLLEINKTDNLVDSLITMKVSSNEYLFVKVSPKKPNNISGTYQFIDQRSTLNATLNINVTKNNAGQTVMDVKLTDIFVIIAKTKTTMTYERLREIISLLNNNPEFQTELCNLLSLYDQNLKNLIQAYKVKATAVQSKASN